MIKPHLGKYLLLLGMLLSSNAIGAEQIKFELKITSLTGSFELPIDVEWGVNYFSENKKTNLKHEGTVSKECTITENKSTSIQEACGTLKFTNIESNLFFDQNYETELLLVQPYSKTDGYGIGGNSTTFRECIADLIKQPIGSVCPMDISDEGVRYTMSLIRLN